MKNNMRNFVLVLLSITISHFAIAQKTVKPYEVKSKMDVFSQNYSVYPFEDNLTKETYFVEKTDTIFSMSLYDTTGKVKAISEFNFPNKKETKLIGHLSDKINLKFYFTNAQGDKYLQANFSKKEQKWTLLPIVKLLPTESSMLSFFHNGILMSLSVEKNTSILNLYKIDNGISTLLKKIELKESSLSKNLYEFTLSSKQGNKFYLVDNELPVGAAIAKQSNKAYKIDNNLVLTVNSKLNDFTTLIDIDLSKFTYKYSKITSGAVTCDTVSYYNSFLHKNILAQIKGCPENMLLTFYDLNSKMIIKKYETNYHGALNMVNDDNLLGGVERYNPELVKANQLVRRMAFSTTERGVSMYQEGDNIVVNLSGYKEEEPEKQRVDPKASAVGLGNGDGGVQSANTQPGQRGNGSGQGGGGSGNGGGQGKGGQGNGGQGKGGQGRVNSQNNNNNSSSQQNQATQDKGAGNGNGGGQGGGNGQMKTSNSTESQVNKSNGGNGGGNGQGKGGNGGGGQGRKQEKPFDKLEGNTATLNFLSQSTNYKGFYAKTRYDLKSFDYKEGALEMIIYDNASKFEKDKRIEGSGVPRAVFKQNGKYVYMYYNRMSRMYEVVSF